MTQPGFEYLWNQADDSSKEHIIKLVEYGDKYGIMKWMRENIDISERSIHELRNIARELNIYNYSRLSKVELLAAIQAKDIK